MADKKIHVCPHCGSRDVKTENGFYHCRNCSNDFGRMAVSDEGIPMVIIPPCVWIVCVWLFHRGTQGHFGLPPRPQRRAKQERHCADILKYALHSVLKTHTEEKRYTLQTGGKSCIISVVQEILLCRRSLRLRRLWGGGAPQGCRVNLVAHKVDVFLFLASKGIWYQVPFLFA